MRERLGSLLAAVCVALAAVLVALWIVPRNGVRAYAWSAPAPLAPDLSMGQRALPSPAAQPPGNFAATLTRPPFLEARRPLPVASAPAASAPAPVDALDKARIVGIAAAGSVVSVMVNSEGQTRVLRPGETLGTWTLSGIEGRAVRFRSGTQERKLELESELLRPGKPAGAGQPGVPPAPPSPAVAQPPRDNRSR